MKDARAHVRCMRRRTKPCKMLIVCAYLGTVNYCYFSFNEYSVRHITTLHAYDLFFFSRFRTRFSPNRKIDMMLVSVSVCACISVQTRLLFAL